MFSIDKNFNQEKPQQSYEQILGKYKSQGERLEKRFAIQIKQAKEGCFKYLGVSSSHELDSELYDDKFPTGFHYSIGLEGYRGEIGTSSGGYEKYVFLSTEKETDEDADEKIEGDDYILQEIEVNLAYGEKVVGFTWNAKGIEHNNKLYNFEHNGVVVDSVVKGKGIGFAMYRLHEEVFGMMYKEITPKLSLLKLYLKLGFEPKKVISPLDGEEVDMNVEEAVTRYFGEGREDLPFWIYLEREEKEDNENN